MTFSVKFKIDFLNNLLTASVLIENYDVVLHEIQQLCYLNSNLMLRWDSHFKGTDPSWKKLSNIPELYAKMLRTFY